MIGGACSAGGYLRRDVWRHRRRRGKREGKATFFTDSQEFEFRHVENSILNIEYAIFLSHSFHRIPLKHLRGSGEIGRQRKRAGWLGSAHSGLFIAPSIARITGLWEFLGSLDFEISKVTAYPISSRSYRCFLTFEWIPWNLKWWNMIWSDRFISSSSLSAVFRRLLSPPRIDLYANRQILPHISASLSDLERVAWRSAKQCTAEGCGCASIVTVIIRFIEVVPCVSQSLRNMFQATSSCGPSLFKGLLG